MFKTFQCAPNEVSKFVNVANPLVISVCFDGNGLTCSIHDFFYTSFSILPSSGKNAKLFLSNPYRAGDEIDPGAGSIESNPHNNIH